MTLSFATTRNEQDEVETGTVVSTGRIGKGFHPDRPLSHSVTREIFKHSLNQRPHLIVSPGQLAQMWNDLLDAGIEKLTRLDGRTPPANTAFIRVATESRRFIFTKPPRLTRQDSDTTALDKQAKMDVWTRCVLVMKSGTLRTDFIPQLRT